MQVKAKRPLNSSLTSTKLPMYNLEMRSWKEALHDYLVEKGHITKK
jgi:dTDP-4-dehydrorhamnose reductase